MGYSTNKERMKIDPEYNRVKHQEMKRMSNNPMYARKIRDPQYAAMYDEDDSDLPAEQQRYPKGVDVVDARRLGINTRPATGGKIKGVI